MTSNADMPANVVHELNGAGEMELTCTGLTKREHFAGMAMQALYSNHHIIDCCNYHKDMAKEAVSMADALMAELKK